MSDSPVAVRAIALSEAVKSGSDNIIATAFLYLDFLQGVGDSATKPAVVREAKPAKAAKAKAEPVVETDDEGADVPTKADVGSVVEKLLGADKRTEAVALMKKFGASSVSTLAEGKYAAFIEAADAILMTA